MKKWSFHWGWMVLSVCPINFFIKYSVRPGYGVVLPEMIKHLGLSQAEGGSIYNSYLFIYIAVTPLTGFLTDRLGAIAVHWVAEILRDTTATYNHAFVINNLNGGRRSGPYVPCKERTAGRGWAPA